MEEPEVGSMTHAQLEEMKGRQRWSAKGARAVLSMAEQSKLPLAEFSRQHGLEAKRLYEWRRRLELGRKSGARFVEVGRGDASVSPIEIVLRNGLLVRVGTAVDVNGLRRLLLALGDAGNGC